MRILIVKLGAIGDVLRTTSILPGLKAKYPLAEIDWITSSAAKDILLNNQLVSQVLIWEQRKNMQIYNIAIGLEDATEACELISMTNAATIYGCYLKSDKVYYTPSAWFDMSLISKFGLEEANKLKKINRKTFQQHMAEMLEIDVGPYIYEVLPEENEYGQKVVKDLGISKEDRVFGINTAAGKTWPLKSLSVEKTIELVNKLRKELGVVSLIMGGPDENERNQTIARETGMPNAGQHGLRKFAGVMNQCKLVVSSDSLAMHLAIALKKRIVAFFGPTSPFEIELYGLGTKIFPNVDCLISYKRTCDKAPCCMDLLSMDDLFAAVKREMTHL